MRAKWRFSIAWTKIQMSVSEVIQLLSISLALGTLLLRFGELARDWRGGSPEIRLVREQMKVSDGQIREMIDIFRTDNQELLSIMKERMI